jgi:hypothetical protein
MSAFMARPLAMTFDAGGPADQRFGNSGSRVYNVPHQPRQAARAFAIGAQAGHMEHSGAGRRGQWVNNEYYRTKSKE